MSKKYKMNIFVRIAIVVFIVVSIISLTQMMMKYNELNDKKESLQSEVEAFKLRIEKLESEIDAPFDNEYIIKIAREKLNLTLPYTVIFYNDYNK